jgi:hypothetical protein
MTDRRRSHRERSLPEQYQYRDAGTVDMYRSTYPALTHLIITHQTGKWSGLINDHSPQPVSDPPRPIDDEWGV